MQGMPFSFSSSSFPPPIDTRAMFAATIGWPPLMDPSMTCSPKRYQGPTRDTITDPSRAALSRDSGLDASTIRALNLSPSLLAIFRAVL